MIINSINSVMANKYRSNAKQNNNQTPQMFKGGLPKAKAAPKSPFNGFFANLIKKFSN